MGSGAFSGKMFLDLRIVENNKIDTYFRAGKVKRMLALPKIFRKEIKLGPHRVKAPRKG